MCEPRPDPEIRAQLCSVVQRARRHIWHGNHHFSRGEGLERTLETVKAVGNTKSTQKTNGKTQTEKLLQRDFDHHALIIS